MSNKARRDRMQTTGLTLVRQLFARMQAESAPVELMAQVGMEILREERPRAVINRRKKATAKRNAAPKPEEFVGLRPRIKAGFSLAELGRRVET